MSCYLETIGGVIPSGTTGGARTWQLVSSLDFTVQASQNIRAGGDGNYVIGGLTFAAANTASSTAFDVILGTGLQITQTAGITVNVSTATLTAPYLRIAMSSFWTSFDPTLDYCLQAVMNYTVAPSNAQHCTVVGLYGAVGSPTAAGARWAGANRGNTPTIVQVDQSSGTSGTSAYGNNQNVVGACYRGSGELIALGAQSNTNALLDPDSMLLGGFRTNEFANSFSSFVQPQTFFLLGTVTRNGSGSAFTVVIPRIGLWAR